MNWRNIIISFICLCTAGCVNKDFDPEKWDVKQWIYLSKKSTSFSSSAGSDTIEVHTNYLRYTPHVEYENSSDDWCTLTINEDKGIIIVKVDPNISTKQRVATVCVEIGRNIKTEVRMPVIQTGGAWDVIAGYTLFLSHEISQTQRNIIEDLLQSLVAVEGGSFDMGGRKQYDIEASDYHVTLDDFIIGKYEITQKQWQGIMGYNPSEFIGENLPVENISWDDAFNFCRFLSELTSLKFRLPTEAQWEFAARGGMLSNGYIYSGSDNLEKVAHNYGSLVTPGHILYHTAEVGSKIPNELGLFDMSGNVREYCQDFYAENYPSGNFTNPTGPSIGEYHILRGGSFDDFDFYLESTFRSCQISSNYSCNGLRIILCK